MKIRLIRSPTEAFVEMLRNNLRSQEKKRFEGIQWGAVGLVQAKLIELYWAADVAEKAAGFETLV